MSFCSWKKSSLNINTGVLFDFMHFNIICCNTLMSNSHFICSNCLHVFDNNKKHPNWIILIFFFNTHVENSLNFVLFHFNFPLHVSLIKFPVGFHTVGLSDCCLKVTPSVCTQTAIQCFLRMTDRRSLSGNTDRKDHRLSITSRLYGKISKEVEL